MKIFSSEHIFNHPWDRVSIANWIKYPNEQTPHVVHVDYLSRHVDPETGILHTERLLTCRQNVPAFISRILGGEDSSLFYEKSEVDPQGRTLTLRSRNLTFCNLLVVEETCRYTETASKVPLKEAATLFKQEASIRSVTGWSHLRTAIEEFGVNRFCANAHRGRLALEHAIERLYVETKGQVLETLHLFDRTEASDIGRTDTANAAIAENS